MIIDLEFSVINPFIANGSLTFGYKYGDSDAVQQTSDFFTIVAKDQSWQTGDPQVLVGTVADASVFTPVTISVPVPGAVTLDLDIVYYRNTVAPFEEVARYQGITVLATGSPNVLFENVVVSSGSVTFDFIYQDASQAPLSSDWFTVVPPGGTPSDYTDYDYNTFGWNGQGLSLSHTAAGGHGF